MSRDAAIAVFLNRAGLPGVGWTGLAQDASFRRYLRLAPPHRLVVMDAPPPIEDVRPFLRVQAHLASRGISVPGILAADPEHGFLLLEDFGDSLFPSVMTEQNLLALYDAAIDTLAALSTAPVEGLPAWDPAAMARAAAATFLDWWWPASFGAPAPPAAQAQFHTALADMLAPLEAGPLGFVHRDYFAGNLFWLPDRAGIRRVGVIDFQDAALGHPAYDLISLVQDARRDLPAALTDHAIARMLAARPELDGAAFAQACVICAAQRHLRVAALWVRLERRDGKSGYRQYAARTWRLLHQALAHAPAAPLRAFLDTWVPPSQRQHPEAT
jgi:aminoglycoside/choline kinase family phosphotransferase